MPERLPLRTLTEYLDTLLDARSGTDYCPNGLQVGGRSEVARVVTGVSACQELFERAIALQADAVIVHHGLFWRGDDRRLIGILRRRVKLLLDADVNLLAYHLPLDRHPDLGNNILAARAFGIADPIRFGDPEDQPLGFGGHLPEALTPDAFGERCAAVFGQEPLLASGGSRAIASAAFVSGAAESLFRAAISQGYDAYVTGEISEWVTHTARESGVHFFAAGHHATERLGIAALGEHLATQFGLHVEFVDVPNPV